MPKLIQSEFRVLEFDRDDVLLTDIADVGIPVYVNKSIDDYSDDLQSKIDELEVGNIIEAEIQSESVSQRDDFWKFVTLSRTDQTVFYFIENAENHPSLATGLVEEVGKASNDSVRTTIMSDGEIVGYVTVGEDQGDRFWNGLKSGTNSHEFDIKTLKNIGDPPYEVIYTRNENDSQLIFYHFVEKGTGAAEAIVSSN